jgi:hypothetical protein
MYDVPYPINDTTIYIITDVLDSFIEYTINPSNIVVTMTITMPIIILIYFFIYMV